MAKSSAHIEQGHGGYFSHNSRQNFTQSQVFFDETNEVDKTKEEAFELFRSLLEVRSNAYEERVNQKLQKNTVTHLSAIVNLEKHHTLESLNPIIDFIEKRLDTVVIQRSVHRDEGKLVHKISGDVLTSGEQFFCNPADQKLYFDQKYSNPVDMNQWTMEKNYHAHLEMMGIDSIGKSIRRNLTTTFFRELQDITAETLGMERGQKTQSYTKEQMTEITSAIGDKNTYENKKAYASAFTAKAKEMGIYINKYSSKRKSTNNYKKAKAIENKAIAKERAALKPKATQSNKAKRATITQLKEINKELRTQLQELGAKRENYAALEEEIKQLKQQIKDKELSEAELNTKNLKLSEQIKELEQKEPEKIEVEKIVYKENTTRIKELETKISTQEQTISNKESEISTLTKQNEALNKKIDTLPSSDTLEELKTLKNDFEESTQIIETLQTEVKKKEDEIYSLEDGYSEIEETIFGKDEKRSVDDIVKGVSNVVNALSNISKYFKIGIQKMVSMFIDHVPKKEEVEKEVFPKIDSILTSDEEKSSSPDMKRMRP